MREDTVLMLERATAPRDVGWKPAVMVIAALSALAGLLTYAVKAEGNAQGSLLGALVLYGVGAVVRNGSYCAN